LATDHNMMLWNYLQKLCVVAGLPYTISLQEGV
jgi:hypothetical protein